MNILQILPELNVGGVETGTVDLAKYLIRLGHKAVIVSGGGSMVKEVESLGAIHYQLPVHKKSIFTMVCAIPKLIEIIKKEKIDIVHARSRVPAWIAYFASRSTRTVFITTCHGYYKKRIFSQVMGWGKRVIVLSNVIGRHMIDDFATPHERIRLIPRSVDLEKFKYTSPDKKRQKEFNVGIIGRITPLKGHLHFIKAMAKVARQVPQLKIWIVGDAPASKEAYKEQVQVLVKRLGLWPVTDFLGTQRDIPGILAHLDLLVLATTTHEAFGRVIIEAQAAGVPVVATRVGGVIDIIEDGKTGILVSPQDPGSIAEAAMKIFRQPQLAAQLAENAYQKVKEKYNIGLMVGSTLGVYQEALSDFKILIIKFSSLGDIILSTAALRQIRKRFPANYPESGASSKPSSGMPKENHSSNCMRHKISFLVGDESKDVLLRSPYIDELLTCDLKNKDKGLTGLLNLAHVLRKKSFDIVIDLQNNRKSHLLAALSLALDRYGYNNRKLGFLLNHCIKDNAQPLDPVSHQFRILNMLGIELEDSALELWPSVEDQDYIDAFLNAEWIGPHQKIIGINIGASQRWKTKSWPLNNLARLCEELARRDMRLVITGTEQDLPQVESLMSMANNVKPLDACARTSVNQLACLIKKCSVYICSDSAPLHIAAAVGTPRVALFGPTDPLRHIQPSQDCAVIQKGLPCSPCYKSKCKTRECMELITPEEVLEAVETLLKLSR